MALVAGRLEAVGRARPGRRTAPARRLRREARRLRREAHAPWADLAEPVAGALESAARRRSDDEARARFRRIEAERRRLRSSPLALSGGSGTTSTLGAVTRRASVPRRWAPLLFHLVRALDAHRCLEIGTGVGVSGAYLTAAMPPGGGRLVSLEGHGDRADVARDSWRRLGLEGAEVVVGRFHRTLPGVLAGPAYDLVFVDGHHDGRATLDYVDRIRRAAVPGTLLVLDDIDWSRDMRQAWSRLCARLTGSVTSDLGRMGLIRLGSADAGRHPG